jgi:hypothetical protein
MVSAWATGSKPGKAHAASSKAAPLLQPVDLLVVIGFTLIFVDFLIAATATSTYTRATRGSFAAEIDMVGKFGIQNI